MPKDNDTQEIIDEIKELQEDIDKAKRELANAEGRIDNIFENLKEKYGINTVKELDDLIKQKEKQVQQIDKKIKEEYNQQAIFIQGNLKDLKICKKVIDEAVKKFGLSPFHRKSFSQTSQMKLKL